MLRVESADELIEFERRLPNIEEQGAAQASALDTALPVYSGVVALMSGAAAVKFS